MLKFKNLLCIAIASQQAFVCLVEFNLTDSVSGLHICILYFFQLVLRFSLPQNCLIYSIIDLVEYWKATDKNVHFLCCFVMQIKNENYL